MSQVSNSDSDSEVHNSQYTVPTVVKLKSENDGVDYNYIDLLAIIQVIKSEDTEIDDKPQKEAKRKKATE